MAMTKLVKNILTGLEIKGSEFVFNEDTWKVDTLFKSDSKCCKATNSKGITQLFNCNFVKECILNMKFCNRLKGKTIVFEGKKVKVLGYYEQNSRLAKLLDIDTGKESIRFIHGGIK